MSDSLEVRVCTRCKKIAWPPSDICPACLGRTESGAAGRRGRVLEVSGDADGFFALVELDCGIRLVGAIAGGVRPGIGDPVVLESSVRSGYELRLA